MFNMLECFVGNTIIWFLHTHQTPAHWAREKNSNCDFCLCTHSNIMVRAHWKSFYQDNLECSW